MTTYQLSREQARRIAVRAQWLHRDRPPGLLDLVRRLTLVQVDLTRAVAPSADLVAWSRLGPSYSPEQLESALGDQALVELQGMIRPAEDLALYRAEMAEWDKRGKVGGWRKANRDWVAANKGCRLDILDRLRTDGPRQQPSHESGRGRTWFPPDKPARDPIQRGIEHHPPPGRVYAVTRRHCPIFGCLTNHQGGSERVARAAVWARAGWRGERETQRATGRQQHRKRGRGSRRRQPADRVTILRHGRAQARPPAQRSSSCRSARPSRRCQSLSRLAVGLAADELSDDRDGRARNRRHRTVSQRSTHARAIDLP